ncbi:uncharacterized protein [Temnothorax longispinosus]|uniref:uncharacterized protein n=1 Tax=Temnothorax longispinosus TaxID=300112 RepID=UPI003A99F322
MGQTVQDSLNQMHLEDSSFIKKFTKNDVLTTIKKLDVHKAPGYDLITAQILKQLPAEAITFLTSLFNAIFRLKTVPSQWKTALVIMILKPGKLAEDVKSYRPISLLPILSKTCQLSMVSLPEPSLMTLQSWRWIGALRKPPPSFKKVSIKYPPGSRTGAYKQTGPNPSTSLLPQEETLARLSNFTEPKYLKQMIQSDVRENDGGDLREATTPQIVGEVKATTLLPAQETAVSGTAPLIVHEGIATSPVVVYERTSAATAISAKATTPQIVREVKATTPLPAQETAVSGTAPLIMHKGIATSPIVVYEGTSAATASLPAHEITARAMTPMMVYQDTSAATASLPAHERTARAMTPMMVHQDTSAVTASLQAYERTAGTARAMTPMMVYQDTSTATASLPAYERSAKTTTPMMMYQDTSAATASLQAYERTAGTARAMTPMMVYQDTSASTALLPAYERTAKAMTPMMVYQDTSAATASLPGYERMTRAMMPLPTYERTATATAPLVMPEGMTTMPLKVQMGLATAMAPQLYGTARQFNKKINQAFHRLLQKERKKQWRKVNLPPASVGPAPPISS